MVWVQSSFVPASLSSRRKLGKLKASQSNAVNLSQQVVDSAMLPIAELAFNSSLKKSSFVFETFFSGRKPFGKLLTSKLERYKDDLPASADDCLVSEYDMTSLLMISCDKYNHDMLVGSL